VFDGVLRGRKMFDSYRGFDVIVEHREEDKKKKKNKNKGKRKDDDAKGDGDDREVDGEVAIAVATDEEDGGLLGKLKVTQGKLVGRDYGVGGDDGGGGATTINVRGRAVKIRNEDIASVSLPKAKREKGVR
jgi:hypothetical protein